MLLWYNEGSKGETSMNVYQPEFISSHLKVILPFFLLVYLAISVLEVIFAYQEKERWRKRVKPFCLLSAGIMMAILFPTEWFLYAGCFFGMIGDIFLLYKDRKCCVLCGMVSFFLNHLFYILEIGKCLAFEGKLDSVFFISISIVCFILLVCSFFGTRKVLHVDYVLTAFGSFYVTILVMDCIMNMLAFLMLGGFFIFGFFGLVLFIISDSILSYSMFIKDFPRRDFYIMSTYLLAQLFFLFSMTFVLI